mgnify:CR=1 FL=1
MTMSEAINEARRCLNCARPTCRTGCPIANNIPQFIRALSEGNIGLAYETIAERSNLPAICGRVCPHERQCEAHCVLTKNKHGIEIGSLEMFIADFAHENNLKPLPPSTGKRGKVAVIGSGPAGLACADQLNKAGHSVTVYERADRAGGLLMYGIPNMKLDKHLVERRIKLLEEAGVTFELNSEIGHKISSETLLKQFDAIALCTGSTVPRDLTIPGRELQGIYFAKDYLHSVTKSFLDSGLQDKKAVSAKGKDVIVIGGGDTGTDCVATAIRQGCRSVKQIEIMPCLPHSRTADNPWPEMPRVFKTDYGQEEAFELYHQDPRDYCIMSKEFIGKNGKVDKLRLCQIDWQKEAGRLIPVEIAGTEQIVSAQLVLLAMGFIGTETQLFDEFKFARSEANTIAANDNDYLSLIHI